MSIWFVGKGYIIVGRLYAGHISPVDEPHSIFPSFYSFPLSLSLIFFNLPLPVSLLRDDRLWCGSRAPGVCCAWQKRYNREFEPEERAHTLKDENNVSRSPFFSSCFLAPIYSWPSHATENPKTLHTRNMHLCGAYFHVFIMFIYIYMGVVHSTSQSNSPNYKIIILRLAP